MMATNELTIRNYTRADLPKLASFFEKYLAVYPDAKLIAPEFYTHHPGFEDGRNVFCALDSRQQLLGFAPLLSAPAAEDCPPQEPHHIWTIVIADPEDGNAAIARNLMLDRVMARAQDLKAALSSRPVRLAADMMTSQRADIEYLSSQGFQAYAAVYVMQRSTVEPAPEVRLPPPLSVRPGKIDSEEDRLAYLRAFNICFPDMPKTLEALRYSLRLPQWAGGIALAALTPQGELAGSVLAYADEARGCGVIDDVFVLPEWRGRGIAKSLIGQGLDYLRAHDVADVRLEVKAGNQPAVAAYRAMGFRIVNEEVLMGKWI